jgi:hypothetical protein
MVTQEKINETVARICGENHQDLTYGERADKIAAHCDTLGWFICWTGKHWALSKDQRILLRESIRDVIKTILDIESGLYQ